MSLHALHSNKKMTQSFSARILAAAFAFSLAFQPLLLLAEETATTTIATDTAIAETALENVVNTNEVQTSSSTPQQIEEVSEPIEEDVPAEEETASSTPVSLDISLESEAEVSNEATTTADTGNNETAGDDSAIETGDAYAGANVLNVVNTNIINSYGLFYLLNTFFGISGNIDVRDFENASTTSLGSCDTGCSAQLTPSSETISASSTASISNSVLVRANTGENSTGGDGTIDTGNAYAGANIINVANTNIIDSNYLLFTFNNFGGWNGDLVLPNADFFTNFFFGGKGNIPASTTLSVDNSANVVNAVSAEANTGENEGGEGVIETGNAVGDTNIFNQINSSLIGGSTLRILVRVHGNWLGSVFNAPEGLQWQQNGDAVEIFGLPTGEGAGSPWGGFSNLSMNSTNNASINNDVSVVALTGENQIGGEGNIQTGNAYAGVNIVNVANTNVIGQNWIFAILNIFGDWSGNISFGQPDLWVGTQVITPEKNFFGPGEEVLYRYTIVNRGDANASGVRLTHTFDEGRFIAFGEGYNYIEPQKGITAWDIGDIPAGGAVELTYVAKISPEIPFKDTEIVSTIGVSATETDGNNQDNTDVIAINATNYVPGGEGIHNLVFTPDPKLVVTKVNDVLLPTASTTTVNYKITIKNEGGIAHHAILVDTLKNEDGDVLNEQQWELGDVYPNEKIEVTYTSVFSKNTPPGVYTNYAQVHSIGRHPSINPLYGMVFDSNIAQSSNTFLDVRESAPQETVKEAATSTPSIVSSTGREIDPTPVIEQRDTTIISQTPLSVPLSIPLSPLLSKVLAFKDSIQKNGGGQTAVAFYAFHIPQGVRDIFLLLFGLLISSLISNYLLSRTRLRNAFTSF